MPGPPAPPATGQDGTAAPPATSRTLAEGTHHVASAACVLGSCDLVCEPGWSNENGNLADGCEATCRVTTPCTEEPCDGLDCDCDGLTDEDWTSAERCGTGLCERSAVCWRGAVLCEPRRPPASTDGTCDGIDDDCDGTPDDDWASVTTCGVGGCARRATCVGGREDCTPGPSSSEVCNGLDDNCDGILPADELDEDGDGFRPCAADCDDHDRFRHPGVAEACDGEDTDCDTLVPDDERDLDGDGYRPCDGDCDDNDAAERPGGVEICDTLDNDCDGVSDDELDCGENCSSVLVLPRSGTYTFDTCGVAADIASLAPCTDNASPDLVVAFDLVTTGSFDLRIPRADPNIVVNFYEGGLCGGTPAYVYCDTDSRIQIGVAAGRYYIELRGRNAGSCGTLTMTLTFG